MNEGLDKNQELARDALRQLADPAADPGFRERLRAEFVSTAPAPRVTARVSPVRRRAGRMATALLATAAVLVIGVALANRGPAWEVLQTEGLTHVWVDETRVAVDDGLEGQLRPGRRIRLPESGTLELVSPGNLVLQLNGALALTVPRSPGRWFDRRVVSRIDGDGVLRVTTGPDFPGSLFALSSDAAEVEVTGTTFTVIHHEGLACVCVLEGVVRACAPEDTEMTGIPSGQRMTFAEFGQSVAAGDMLPSERDALNALRSRAASLFAR